MQKDREAFMALICKRISQGESLRSICEADGMPSRSTVRLWLLEDKALSVQYARAREEQADFYADEIIEIADQAKDAQLARLQTQQSSEIYCQTAERWQGPKGGRSRLRTIKYRHLSFRRGAVSRHL